MTVVKLKDTNKCNIRKDGCTSCIFCKVYENTEYGELTGRIDMYCDLLDDGTIFEDESCYAIETLNDDFVLENCPIISIEEDSE